MKGCCPLRFITRVAWFSMGGFCRRNGNSKRTKVPRTVKIGITLAILVAGFFILHNYTDVIFDDCLRIGSFLYPEFEETRLFSFLTDRDVHLGNFVYKINEDNLCNTESNSRLILLVGVFSAPHEVPLRDFIRSRWGNAARQNQKIKLIFILGESSMKNYDSSLIRKESSLFHDIVLANFTDSYRNLTYKSLALFQWAKRYCSNAKYILKIDGDMQIDLHRLSNVLETQNVPDKYQCGWVIPPTRPTRAHRDIFYVPYKFYMKDQYPVYCAGPAYIVSRRIADKISNLPIPVSPFPVDDVFMTGVLRHNLQEDVEKRIISFYHHTNATDTLVKDGHFQKYIMTIEVHSVT